MIARGRVTIPQTIRDLLGLKDGDYVEVHVNKVQNSKEASP